MIFINIFFLQILFIFEIGVLQETSNKSLVLVKMFSYTTKQVLVKQKKIDTKCLVELFGVTIWIAAGQKNALPVNFS